jgi:hypothetical protein
LPFFIFIICPYFYFLLRKKKICLGQAWSSAQPCWALDPPLAMCTHKAKVIENNNFTFGLTQPQIFTLIPFFEILHMLCKFLNVSIDFIFIWNHFKKYTNPISTYRNIKITWLDSMTKILEIRIQTLVLHLCDEFIIVCHSYPIKKNMNYK